MTGIDLAKPQICQNCTRKQILCIRCLRCKDCHGDSLMCSGYSRKEFKWKWKAIACTLGAHDTCILKSCICKCHE